MSVQIHLSRNFCGNMQVPAETLSRNSIKMSAVASQPRSQLDVGEKFCPQKTRFCQKPMIFGVPLRFVGSGTETGIDILGFD